jgi:hypothetical protein
MKKILMFICAVTLVLGMAGTASAIPYTDTYDAGHVYMRGSLFGSDDSVSWTFDITDPASGGFNPGTQDVTSASVRLNFSDDGWDFFEFARLDVGENRFYWEVDTGNVGFAITSLMTLSDTGRVAATLTARWGDFYFNSATLSAIGTELDPSGGDAPAPVPEPSTILLMGTGILGLVAYGRKRYNKKA